MVRPMFFSAYFSCWYEFLIFGPVRIFSHFQTSLLILLNTVTSMGTYASDRRTQSQTIKTTEQTFWPGVFKQPTNSPAPARYPAPIELRLMPNWCRIHSTKLSTQLQDCQVKKLMFINPCGEKTYVLPYFSLYAGGKQVQVLYRPFVILFCRSLL